MRKTKIIFTILLIFLLLGLGYEVYAKYVISKNIQIPYTTVSFDPTQVSVTTTKEDDKIATVNATATDNGAGVVKYEFYINDELKETATTSDLSASYSFDYVSTFGTTYDAYVIVTDGKNNASQSNISQIVDYTISTKEDFELFRDSVNAGNTYKDETIIQTADINLEGSETNQWTPIGNYGADTSLTFNGTFDGNNCTISNLYINSESNYQALFGMVRSATIKNITVEGQITSTGNRVAGIAAYASGSNNVIEFCTNKATINGNGEVGGIIGASGYSGTISKCRNLGTITGGESSTYVGGIIGSHTMASSLTIEYCYNTGTISADSSLADLNGGVAGITGHIMEGGSVKNCYNTASITRTYNNATYTTRAAGIVASQREKSSIINCYNTGKISAINTASSSNIVSAGITATAATSADVTVTIENCYYLDGSAEYGIYMQNTTQYKTIINDTVSTTDTSLYPEALDGIIENRNETLFKGAINSTTSVTYLLNNNGTTNIWTINNGYPILWWQTDAIFNETEKVNTPKIDETQGMKLVTFNTTTKTWEEDTTKSDYAYVAGTGTADNTSSRWANAVVTKNGVDSYFVWIPRYAYKIDSTNQKIDVKFIDGTGTTAFDGTVCKYADDSTLTSDDYIIHPAFTSNANLGGGFGQLSGLWIGKFESSRSDADATTAGTSTTLKVVPNVKSWTNTTIGEFYTYAKGYNANLNSHMLKNSEWGAVAYLAHSQYGRNGNEIAVSQCTDIITGAGPGTGDSNIYNSSYAYSASDFETTYSYTSEQGKKASTTGNEYGIYDITGGVYEYVASYYNVWESPSKYLAYASSFASSGGTSNKYATVYTGAEMSRNYIKGDATYETSGWNSDATDFYLERDPFFIRGGVYFLTDNAGIFRSTVTFGAANELYGFRACLAVE